ncbi:MAG: hypothetical protein LUF04_02760 [Bacteroides sp.]|nr:hypothetical protein [Bacteroides sp.]
MKEKDIPCTLFSERFEQVYSQLGTFLSLYFLSEGKGVSIDEFLAETQYCDTEEIVCFLQGQEILIEEKDRLHLNVPLFFSLSVWDLLIRVEPWIRRLPVVNSAGLSTEKKATYQAIREFTQTHALSDSYVRPIW